MRIVNIPQKRFERIHEVKALKKEGLSNAEIGRRLNLSGAHVGTIVQMAARYEANGIVPVPKPAKQKQPLKPVKPTINGLKAELNATKARLATTAASLERANINLEALRQAGATVVFGGGIKLDYRLLAERLSLEEITKLINELEIWQAAWVVTLEDAETTRR